MSFYYLHIFVCFPTIHFLQVCEPCSGILALYAAIVVHL